MLIRAQQGDESAYKNAQIIMQNRMLKNIAFFERNKIAKSLQNALNGANRKYQLYFTQDEINIVDLQNRRFLYPKGAFVSVAQNIAQTPLNNDKWRIYANNLRLKKLQKNSDGNYGVANLKATAEAINKMVGIANYANAESKLSPSLAEGKLQSLPLPCGGGLRGWVDSQKKSSAKSTINAESSAISQNLNAESNPQNTHPLAPSAREGEQKTESAPASSLRVCDSKAKQSAGFANEVKQPSKSRESNKKHESMTQKRINTNSLQVSDSPKTQIIPNGLPRFGVAKSRNDETTREYAQETIAQNAYHLPPLFLPQTNIFGLCGGLFLDILLEMGYFFHSLLIYEEEAELFALSNYFVDYELLFSRTSPKSCYIFIENLLNKGLLNHYFYSKKITNNFLRLELSLLKSPKIEAFKQLTFETYRANARGWGSFEDEMVGLKNAFINAKNAPFLRLNHKLKTPICVVGSGPSLESNINFIRANQNKMLIFSCGTALKVLKAHKIRIDFQIEIERVPYLAEVLQSSNLGDTATLCASLVNPKVLQISQNTLLFMRGGSAASYIFDKIAPQIAPLEFCAPFVGNAGFSLACAMSDEIIMCGMDCGFVRGFAKHASGSIYGDERAEIPADCFKVEGNCADFEVFGNAIFSLSKESFALAIAHYKPKSVHNLSFGAKIKGAVFAPNLTLKSIAKREKLPHFLISESQVDLAKADLKKGAILFAGELINALNCEISTKEQLFAFIDKMSEFLAHTSQNNPKVGILFEGSMCHLLQSAMIAMLVVKSNDIKTPFCACRTAILGAIADFEAQIKEL
ncbi:motility associated factor glycosyltransferase family protein [Helicobacter sp. 23-1045]